MAIQAKRVVGVAVLYVASERDEVVELGAGTAGESGDVGSAALGNHLGGSGGVFGDVNGHIGQ